MSHLEVTLPETIHQRHQRHLGRVGDAMEHRLAEERATEVHAVQSTRQLGAEPDLHRMGDPPAMQGDVAVEDVLADPGPFARPVGARAHHVLESRIDAY